MTEGKEDNANCDSTLTGNYLSKVKGAHPTTVADHRRMLHETRRTSSLENRESCATNDEGEDGSRGALASAGQPVTPSSSATATCTSAWWHVNKGGFPIPADTWERMWQHIVDVHPNGREVVKAIRGQHCKRVSHTTSKCLLLASIF